MEYEKFEHPLYKNQVCIEVDKKKRSNEIWSSYNIGDMFEAMKTLSRSSFELYLYLVSNIDGYKFGLGLQPVMNATGMSESSYRRAVKELKDKNYLTYHNEHVRGTDGVTAPKWYFHSSPVFKNDK